MPARMSGYSCSRIMSAPIRIAIVDHCPLFMLGLCHTLRHAPGLTVVGEGATAADAIRFARNTKPDILILDTGIPGGGLAALREISGKWPDTKVIMLTGCSDKESVFAALTMGARGYVLKGISGPEFINVVSSIQQGQSYVSPMLAALILRDSKKDAGGESKKCDRDALTAREQRILDLVSRGLTNKEVALSLNISDKTVKHHMSSICQKLQAKNRLEAVLVYLEKGH